MRALTRAGEEYIRCYRTPESRSALTGGITVLSLSRTPGQING